jgi:hypothetical protein
MAFGMLDYAYISWVYINEVSNQDLFSPDSQLGKCIFSQETCASISSNFWFYAVGFWALLNTMWVGILVVSQIGQIWKGMTTNEAINHLRFDYLIHPDDLSAPTYRRRVLNPFNAGLFGNCIDFWSNGDGPFKSISWFSIYDVPQFLKEKAMTKDGYKKVKTDCADKGCCASHSSDTLDEMV